MEFVIITFLYLFALGVISFICVTTVCFFINKKHGGKKNFFEYFTWYLKRF